jgi:hypothetical protein
MAVALSIAIMVAARCNAQATNGDLPEVMTVATVAAHAAMLGLSPQQQLAMQDLHKAYRESYQRLRETVIEPWLQAEQRVPTRKHVSVQRQLIAQIAALDESFFDSLAPILAETQSVKLQRVRLLRERERCMQLRQPWRRNDAPPFDVSQAIAGLSLSSEQAVVIDGELAAYEGVLTKKFRQVIDAYFDTFEATFRATENAGIQEERLSDPDVAKAWFDATIPIWNQSAIGHHKTMLEITALNRKALDQISALLPEGVRRQLNNDFLGTTYPQIRYLCTIRSSWDEALATKGLSDQQRRSLTEEKSAYDKEIDEAVHELVVRVEAYRDKYMGSDDRKGEFDEREAIEKAVNDAWMVLAKRRASDKAKIAALTGQSPVEGQEAIDPETATAAQVGQFFYTRPEISVHLPPAINIGDVAQYVQWLGLDDATSVRLSAVFDQYRAQISIAKDELRPVIIKTSDAMWGGDSIEGFTQDNVRQYEAAEATARARQQQVEKVFFIELARASGRTPDDPGMSRIDLARQRQWFSCGIHGSDVSQPGGRMDGFIDLSLLLRQMRNIDVRRPEIDAILFDYEQKVTPLLKARYDAVQIYKTGERHLRIEWHDRQLATGEKFPNMNDRYKAVGMSGLRMTAIKAAEPIANVNNQTVEKLLKVLLAAEAERVRRMVNRFFWPRIYNDPAFAGTLIANATQLLDLSQDQRTAIENLAADFHSKYDEYCERMKTLVSGPDSGIYTGEPESSEKHKELMQQRLQRQRVQFERFELNADAWQRLKSILSAEQSAAVGLGNQPPAAPGEDDDYGW